MPTPTPPTLNAIALIPFVGMYSIPARLLPEAKKRGVNCIFHSESESGKVSQADWRSACREQGLYYFDFPSDDLDADAEDLFLVGWIIRDSDEWNRKRRIDGVDQVVDPAAFIAEADRLNAYNATRMAAGKQPVYVCANGDGPTITTAIFEKPPYDGRKNNERALYRRVNGRFMDWYPAVGTASNAPSEIARRPDYLPAQAVQRIFDWMRDEPYVPPGDGPVPLPVTAWYGAIVEANTGHNRPVAVTPDRMQAQIDFLLGRTAFPYPADPKYSGKTIVQKIIDRECVPRTLIHWTANGLDGAGWKWIAQTDAQAQKQLEINRMLLGAPGDVPNDPAPAPTPVPDTVAKLQAEFDQFRSTIIAMVGTIGATAQESANRLDAIANAAGRPAVPRTGARAAIAASPVIVGDDVPWNV
jgi:hypothetical protein